MSRTPLRSKFPSLLPPGMGVMIFPVYDNTNREVPAHAVDELKITKDGAKITIYYGNRQEITFKDATIKIRDMYYRACRGEIANLQDYDDNGARKDGTPLIVDLLEQIREAKLIHANKPKIKINKPSS